MPGGDLWPLCLPVLGLHGGGVRALATDLYELTMAASYLRRSMREPATFSLFVRHLPPERGFLVAAGLEDALDVLEQLAFDAEDVAYLAELGFPRADVAALSKLRFTGEVWAVPEGTAVFADEPLLEVTAPLPEAQLAETILLNQVTFQTAVASKAARCRLAAGDRIALVDFAMRRTHGVEAAMAVARLSALAGFAGTSNVAAARRYGLVAAGTMAHSYVQAFPSEAAAFDAFAHDVPGRTTLLVDTFDTLEGVRTAIATFSRLAPPGPLAVRLDSGDLGALATATRRLLDEAGLPQVRIFVSGGLDEHDLEELVRSGAPVDAAGIGTRLGVSADAPALDSAYKLVVCGGRPVVKLSPGKATLPGAKQVHRRAAPLEDVIALREEGPPPGGGWRPLLEPVMRHGRRLRPREDLAVARHRLEEGLRELPPGARRLRAPDPVRPRCSPHLTELAATLRSADRG